MNVSKLPFRHRDTWRWRWLQTSTGNSSILHRLTKRTRWNRKGEIAGYPEAMRFRVCAEGWTACGMRGVFEMPGILSRMGARRCPRCCDVVGVPHGRGAPFNGDIREPGCQGVKKP